MIKLQRLNNCGFSLTDNLQHFYVFLVVSSKVIFQNRFLSFSLSTYLVGTYFKVGN